MVDQQFVRQIAKPVHIKTLLEGSYHKSEGDLSNYLLGSNAQQYYRVSIIATVIETSKQGSINLYTLDDGSGQLSVKSFEQFPGQSKIALGDVILCIGKIREYNAERYLAPEIAKKCDPLWLKVRALQLSKQDFATKNPKQEDMETSTQETPTQSPKELETPAVPEPTTEEIVEEELQFEKSPADILLETIRGTDKGDGVLIEELIQSSKIENVEEILQKMIEQGEIYQNLPGKVKIL